MPNLIIEGEDSVAKLVNQTDYNTRHRTSQTKTKTILPDMIGFPIDEELKQMAESVYNRMGRPIKKDKGRLYMVFVCIHCAMKELDRIHFPKELANMVGVPSNKISSMMNTLSWSKTKTADQTGYESPLRLYSIENYISLLGDRLNIPPLIVEESQKLIIRLTGVELGLTDIQQDMLASAAIIYISSVLNINDTVYSDEDFKPYVLTTNGKPGKIDTWVNILSELDTN